MSLRLPYFTLADPTLNHQVVFYMHDNHVHVSCNCLAGRHNSHQSMGVADGDLAEARGIYNDPNNHAKPFGEEDKAKW